MNTALFQQAKPSLDNYVRTWFKTHPGILEPEETIDVHVTIIKTPPVKTIVKAYEKIELEKALNMSLNEFEMSAKTNDILTSAGLKTLRDLVTKTETDLLRMKPRGAKFLKEIYTLLQGIDPHLRLGMKFPTTAQA